MPKIHRTPQEEATQNPQVFSRAGRKATRRLGAVNRFDAPAIDRTRLTRSSHQNGRVAPEVAGDVADQVLAAVVPRWGDRLGYEKDFSHSPRCYAVHWRTASA